MVNQNLNLSGSYICENCKTTVTAPTHCGRPMALDTPNNSFVCWKGEHAPCCGKESRVAFQSCCDAQNFVPVS